VSDVPVLVDAWSQGCGPCKLLEPVVMQLAKDYRGRIKVTEFDVATAPKIASRLGVTGTPTVVYFSKGREVERVVGYRAGHYHRELIDQELLAP
jgi:thioredoxin 1